MNSLGFGISGCNLQLLSGGWIRKISPSESYNYRLKRQMQKQEMFSKWNIGPAFAPRIIKDTYIDKLYSFDMEYVRGLSSTEFLILAGLKELEEIIRALYSYFDFLNSKSSFYDETEVRERVRNKLLDLRDQTNYIEFIECLLTRIDTVPISCVPRGFCHGDLTLSNILFYQNRLCVLDFLDSYLDSYWIDLIKLGQDMLHGWSMEVGNIPPEFQMRIRQGMNKIWKAIETRYSTSMQTEIFQILDAINYLRIEPYVKTPIQQAALQVIIRGHNLYDNINSTNSR